MAGVTVSCRNRRPYSNANNGTTYVTVLVMAVPVVWIIR